jgi:iron(III) transport system substrate-binding protein
MCGFSLRGLNRLPTTLIDGESCMRYAIAAVTAALLTSAVPAAAAASGTVNIYSYRQPFLIQPLLDAFTAETGTTTNVVYAQQGMLERLKAEGANSPADVVLTVDVGRLNDMVEADLLQPVTSPVLDANIPPQYRHPDGLWYGLTLRSRVILASQERMQPGDISSYEDLADPRFRGKVCSRSGKHVYNVSMIASVIAHKGVDGAREWLEGVKANLAVKPQGNDRAQAKAISEGVCDVAMVNTYYLGAMATNEEKPEEKAWAEAVRLVWPNQEDRGAHVNISGAAVTRSSSNTAEALRLVEFLSSDSAQALYAAQNFEFPVKPGVELDPLVASWGPFKADEIPLAEVAKNRAEASRLVDRVGFDEGPGS